MIYLLLFYEFFKTGLFAVGGGLATLPFLSQMADKYDWLTHDMLANMIAVAESTPGPIGINCATYAGFAAAGIPGALVATMSLVLPSFIVILIVARFLARYNDSRLVRGAFSGLRPAVTGLIGAAGWAVIAIAVFSGTGSGLLGMIELKQAVLFAVLAVLVNLKPLDKLHPLAFIGVAAVAGIVFKF
ncbi:MAG: chromate transporter [Clostridia bacterium]